MVKRTKKSAQREWRRMDLHLHTPASADYKQPNVTFLDLLKKAESKNLDVISFTDHNSVAGYARFLREIDDLETFERLKRLRDEEREQLNEYRRLREKILILPGFEITATLGFHVLGIFSPETPVRDLEHLLLTLRVPSDKLDEGSGEVGATSDVLTIYRTLNEAGALVIAAHANSSHGVAMPGFDFGGQTRIAYTQDNNLHVLEVTDLDSKSRRRTAMFFNGAKPEYPRRMHCIQGSDSHKLDFEPKYKNEMGLGDRATEILLDEISFEAIKAVFQGNDFSRTRPYRAETEEPFDPLREAREQGDTLVQAFHEHLVEKRGVERKILEDVVALANTNGGTLYIGASSNVKRPVVGVDRPDHASTELRAAIAKSITPPIEVQIDTLKSHGKNVLQVIVPRGSDVPYALESSYIYVRSENESNLAVRDEIVQLVRDSLAVEYAAMEPIPQSIARIEPPEPVVEQIEIQESQPIMISVEPPRTGVQIVSSEARKGTHYYSVRDLRNSRIVHNVTLASARSLWQYAIEQAEKNPCTPGQVQWHGEIGLWKSYKRGGKLRYDLAQRVGDELIVYYGVTEDGVHGVWRVFVEGESAVESEVSETEAHLEAATASEISVADEMTKAVQASEHVEEHEEEFLHPHVSVTEEGEVVELAPLPFEAEPESVPEEPGSELDEMPYSFEPIPESEADLEMDDGLPEPEPIEPTKPIVVEAKPIEPPQEIVQPPAPKTRAQSWREKLNRAMADMNAPQASAVTQDEGSTTLPELEEAKKAEEEIADTNEGQASAEGGEKSEG